MFDSIKHKFEYFTNFYKKTHLKMESGHNQNDIQQLWELLYPHAQFNYDYSYSCVAIIKELKNLCNPQFRAILAVIYRAILKEPVPANMDYKELCQRLENYADKLCLRIPEYTVYRSSGAVPQEKPIGPETCSLLKKMLIFGPIMGFDEQFPVSFFFYNISLPEYQSQGPYYPFRLKGVLADLMSTRDPMDTIKFFTGHDTDFTKLRRFIDFDAPEVRDIRYLAEDFVKGNYENMVARWRDDDDLPKLSEAVIRMLMYLHQGFRTGKLDLNLKWNELCKTEYVKNFKL